MAEPRKFQFKDREPAGCARCGEPLPLARSWRQYQCAECRSGATFGRKKNGSDAHAMVAMAVRLGYLKPARECSCVDCSNPAEHYDHRDYNKPLEVEAVCRPCNYKRGIAVLRDERCSSR